MASSLSRPDPSSPASVAEAAFNTSRRGFQPDEVRAFLVAVAAEMGRLQERERQLEAELRDAREVERPAELDDETVASLLGEETLRVLQTARESASHIKIRAEDTAARILREANDEANRVRQDADVEAARRRQDAVSEAEAEVALAKQQGREMVNEARAYRERVLADLERRTTLARQQIEELIHGRDRLLQVFERARLVAVDVTSELTAIDSPDELVNLTPTTGPLPIMVPNERRPAGGSEQSDTDVSEAASTGGDASVDLTKSDVDDAYDDLAEHPDVTTEASDGTVAAAVASDDDEGDEAAVGADATGDAAVVDEHADASEATHDTAGHTEDPAETHDTAGHSEDPADTHDTAGHTEDPADTHDTAGHTEDPADTHDTADTDGVIDTDGIHGAADTDDIDGAADTDDTEGTKGAADTNVVSLFRGRQAPAETAAADDHPSTDSDDPAASDDTSTDDGGAEGSDERPDVGGIFERLRQSVPDGDTTTVTARSNVTDANGAESDVDDGADAESDADAVPESNAFTRRDEALVPLIVAGARRVKRVLADEQNEALDTLRQGEPVTELDDLVPTIDEHVAAYLSALDEELQSAAASGAGELGSNDTKTLRKKLAKAGALATAESHVRSALVVPLRDRLERAIADGDGDNDDITKRVRAVYREWKTQHIDDQLDDVFRSAYSGGLHAAAAPGSRLVWTSDPRVAPCPDCEDNALAGPIVVGDDYPTGHPSTPAHPGCTCLTLPVD